MKKIYGKRKFEAILHQHDTTAKLLQALTNIDLKLFFGYLGGQFVVGSFVVLNSPKFGLIYRLSLLLLDIVLTMVVWQLLKKSRIRRQEARIIINNCNEALGYTRKGVFLEDRSTHYSIQFKPWFKEYRFGIIAAFFGFFFILMGKYIEQFLGLKI